MLDARRTETMMSDDKVTMTEVERRTLDASRAHADEYLQSRGARGHIRDFTVVGGYPSTPCLLLETFGRKTGERRFAPLIYGAICGQYVIVASKGGADVHPGWYLNLLDEQDVTIQIATQAFRASWREPKGAERSKIWEFMCDVYPPYRNYQAGTPREIPVVMFKPVEAVAVLEP